MKGRKKEMKKEKVFICQRTSVEGGLVEFFVKKYFLS